MWSLWSPLWPTHVSFKSLNAIKTWCSSLPVWLRLCVLLQCLSPQLWLTTQSQRHVTTDDQSVCLDVVVLMPRCLYCLTITVVTLWGALSDERSGLSIVSQSLHF
jgi:hypothetical protein